MKKKLSRVLIMLSLIANLICVAGATAIIEKKGGIPWVSRKVSETFHPTKAERNRGDYASNRVSVFQQLPIRATDIVFLGDSIFDFGEWQEFMSDVRAKNRAINGDNTHTVLERLDQIIMGHPRHVVLLLGVNNFQGKMPFTQTIKEYAEIVTMITSESPHTDMWLLPTLPVNTVLYRKWIVAAHPGINIPKQSEVEKLNAVIKKLSNQPHVHFVDMPFLLDQTGGLSEAYTLDGLHLNGQGLKEIARTLAPYLKRT